MAASVSGVSRTETVAKNWVVLLCCLCRWKQTILISICAWGKGYATEACRRLIRLAFEESSLTEVVATFEVGNIASRNVLEKAGFVDHGTMRCYGEDGPNYRITRDGWLELQQSAAFRMYCGRSN